MKQLAARLLPTTTCASAGAGAAAAAADVVFSFFL
jgi:hypothetical protein